MNNKKIKNRKSKKKKISIEIIAISLLVLLFSGIGICGYLLKDSDEAVSDNAASANEVIELPIGFREVMEEVNKPEEEKAPMQIVAHRGYCSVAPENTMQAFVRSVDVGADMIELDVQMTRDGYIVIFHDLNLYRIVGDKKNISDYTYAELLSMDFGSYKSSKFTGLSERMRKDCYAGEKIITLDELLAYFSGEAVVNDSGIMAYIGQVPSDVLINLELKDLTNFKGISQAQKDTFAAAVVSRVYAYGLQDRVVFASFNHDYLDQIEALNPANYTLCVTENGDADWLLEHYPADSYSMDLNVVTEDAIAKFHAAGAPVYVWTANTSDMMRYALSLDADGIITNYPGIASVLVHDEYAYIRDNYTGSYTAPAIYDYVDCDVLDSYVMSGFTIADPSKKSIDESEDKDDKKKDSDDDEEDSEDDDKDIPVDPLILISAYDIDGEKDSILYVMDMEGVLLNIIDLGIKGDMNSLAYDADRSILWMSCRDEYVYALDWEDICNGAYGYDVEEVRASLSSDATDSPTDESNGIIAVKSLYKVSEVCGTNISSVAFIAYEEGELYIGASSDGSKLYKIEVNDCEEDKDDDSKEGEGAQPYVLELIDTYVIPENIEGVSFKYEAVMSDSDSKKDEKEILTYMVMTRRSAGESTDSELMFIAMDDIKKDYSGGYESYVIPERAMQPYVQDDKIYLPFQSASRPYLHKSKVINDQIWVVDRGRS